MELIREGDGKWKIAAIDFASLHEFEKNGRVTDEVQKKIDLLKKRSFKQRRDFPLLTRTEPERVSKSPLTSVEQTVTEPDSSWLDVLLTIGKYALYLGAIILILALVAVLWIGYGLVFAGHRLFKASCKDPSIQKIPAAERWAMAVGALMPLRVTITGRDESLMMIPWKQRMIAKVKLSHLLTCGASLIGIRYLSNS